MSEDSDGTLAEQIALLCLQTDHIAFATGGKFYVIPHLMRDSGHERRVAGVFPVHDSDTLADNSDRAVHDGD